MQRDDDQIGRDRRALSLASKLGRAILNNLTPARSRLQTRRGIRIPSSFELTLYWRI